MFRGAAFYVHPAHTPFHCVDARYCIVASLRHFGIRSSGAFVVGKALLDWASITHLRLCALLVSTARLSRRWVGI